MAKKRETYGSITRKLNALLERQEQEKKRIAGVMAETLLTDRIAIRLGDYSDTEVKKVMQALSGYLDRCIAQVENEQSPNGYHAGTVSTEHPVNV